MFIEVHPLKTGTKNIINTDIIEQICCFEDEDENAVILLKDNSTITVKESYSIILQKLGMIKKKTRMLSFEELNAASSSGIPVCINNNWAIAIVKEDFTDVVDSNGEVFHLSNEEYGTAWCCYNGKQEAAK